MKTNGHDIIISYIVLSLSLYYESFMLEAPSVGDVNMWNGI